MPGYTFLMYFAVCTISVCAAGKFVPNSCVLRDGLYRTGMYTGRSVPDSCVLQEVFSYFWQLMCRWSWPSDGSFTLAVGSLEEQG